MDRPVRSRVRIAANALVLLAGCLAAIAVAAVTAPQAHAGTAPPPPAGYTTVFSDNFAGPAGSAPSSANWFYDIGTGFGTGEIEHMTSSTANSYLDGNGHLVLKSINNGGTWQSARLESTRDDFAAPPGGKLEITASIEQPNPASGLGYWPAFWTLGSPMRAGGTWPQSGELDIMEDVNALNESSQTLHDGAGSSGHALIACPDTSSTCQTGYHTYTAIIDRTNTSAETLQFLMDGTVESTITEASVGTAAWQAAIDHGFYILWDLAMGGNYPNGICNCTTPTSATTSGASISAAYVAVYEEGGNTTPTATVTGTGKVTGINGLCLTNQNSLNTEGNPMFVSACNGSAGQQWTTYSDSTVRVQGGCLDVNAAGTTSGTAVKWYACNGTAAQTWTHQSNGELVNPHSGLCLTDPGNNTATALDIETCTGAAGQTWTLPSGTATNTVTVTTPPQPDHCRQYGGEPAGPGQRLGVRADPDLQRHRPARRAVDQLLDRADLRHPDHRRHLERHGHREGHHRGLRIRLVQLDSQHEQRRLRNDEPGVAPAHHRVLGPGRVLARVQRHRRQPDHPLVQRLRRPPVAASRPRLHPARLPGRHPLGGRLRQGLPDPDIQRRRHLDHHLLHHHRHRRHPDTQHHRQRPLHPHRTAPPAPPSTATPSTNSRSTRRTRANS